MSSKKLFKPIVYLLLSCLLSTSLVGCNNEPTDIVNPNPNQVTGKEMDEKFIDNSMRLAIELFKKTHDSKENSLISPLSITIALAMTTNGADNETLRQMQTTLGKDISIEDLNEYLYTYIKNLPSTDKAKFHLANSIWFKDADSFNVNEQFLQTNADYYQAQLYKEPFNNETVNKINQWVKENTLGMIDKIINELSSDAVMVLLNALAFEADWERPYDLEQVFDGPFTNINGKEITVDMMHSKESSYLEDENTIGFIKPYVGGTYSFVALLPCADIDIETYISELTADKIQKLLDNPQTTSVIATLPKFSYSFETSMNEILEGMGITEAFSPDKADFSKLSDNKTYISEVIHKTFIQVDELGTKAGAVTSVTMNTTAAPIEDKIVTLDRPFIYMIIDQDTNLPIFIGTVLDIQK